VGKEQRAMGIEHGAEHKEAGAGWCHGSLLYVGEWFFTILFTIEYLLRLFSVGRPMAYATSFFGLVDLLAIPSMFFGHWTNCFERAKIVHLQ
jgi:hypothetical protein